MFKATKLIATAAVMSEATGLQIASRSGLETTKGATKGYHEGKMDLKVVNRMCWNISNADPLIKTAWLQG